jgi:phage terminase Nu1 subunit (DNA packaging protein)
LRKPYTLATSVRNYLRFLRSNRGTLTNERSRLTKCQADLAELNYRERQGELILRAAVADQQFRTGRQVRDNFFNLPSRTDALVAAEPDRQKCFDILTREMRQCLESIQTQHAGGDA